MIEAIEASLPELRPFMPFAHANHTVEQQYERLVGVQRDFWGSGDKVFHAWEGARLIACFGLHLRTLNVAGFEIGFWVRSDVSRQGVGTHLTRCLLVLGFDHFDSERVQILNNAGNEGSQRITEKCGFTREGTLRNFESAPSPEMVANGATEDPNPYISSILRSDLPRLAWLPETRASMEVLNWQGSPIDSACN